MINPYLSCGIFVLSNQCPFACDYCYNQWCTTSKEVMPLDTIKKGIDFLIENYSKLDQSLEENMPGVFFLGGEPLLHFDELIVPAVQYLNQNYPNIQVRKTITTDAYLLTLDKIQTCAELGINVNISLDGNKDVQDAHRKLKNGQSAFQEVFAHTQYAISYKILQAINSVYCPDTIGKLSDTYFFFKSIGVPLWLPHPLIHYNWSQKQKEIFAIEVEKICYDYCATDTPDLKIGPLSLEKQKKHNTLLFYSNGDISYNFPEYFVPPKEYPYLQQLGNINFTPIFDIDKVKIFQEILKDKRDNVWFGNMPKEICNTCPLDNDCITPFKTDNLLLQDTCRQQDPMECYQRRLFKIYEQRFRFGIR